MIGIVARWWRRRARRAALSADWAAAVLAYRGYLKRCPLDAAAWIQLGHALKEAGDATGAIEAYDRATRLAPANADAWFQLGHAHRLVGHRSAAIDGFCEALRLVPDFAAAIDAMLLSGERDRLPDATQASQIAGPEAVYALARYTEWRKAYRVPEPPACGRASRDDWVLAVAPDTALHPDAARWLHAAAERTGASCVYCDYEEIDDKGVAAPAFQPMFDPRWFSAPDRRPPVVLFRRARERDAIDPRDIVAHAGFGPIAHLPLLLASVARQVSYAPTVQSSHGAPDSAAIQVIVQTRDEAKSLAVAVKTLRATARRPELLDILIIDNRSIESATGDLLARWQAEGVARVLCHDEPFNWARANNRGVAAGSAPLLLFLNNDTEALSRDWDERAREELAVAQTGILGALLRYPDRTIQHCGIVFGMNQGGPVHEGAAQPLEPGGPQKRWQCDRTTAAVTGAWYAMRRAVFEELAGFDERFAVAFNDVDLCLRARSKGYRIAQSARIVAAHHESLTRGLHLSSQALARDREEYARLVEKWGEGVGRDPAYNPHWTRTGSPFDGLRFPATSEVLDWLDRSARADPWRLDPLDSVP